MKITTYSDLFRQDIIDLVLSVQNDEYHMGFTLEEQPELDDPTLFEQSGGRFWLAVDGEKLIGTIGFMPKSDTVAVLKKFFVRKEFRGTGVSRELYETFLQFARENGTRQVILDTPSVVKRAHRFYEREGFRRITHAELPVHYEYPDRDCYLYMLDLK